MKPLILLGFVLWFIAGASVGSTVTSVIYSQLLFNEPKPVREPEWFKYQQRVAINTPFWNGIDGTICGLIHRHTDGKCEYLVRLDVEGYLALWFETQELRAVE